MRSKVVAAEMASAAGIPAVIGSGLVEGVIARALAGEPAGTRFAPQPVRHSSFKLWLKYAKPSHGIVTVDAGAARALREGAASLLPVGIVDVQGGFDAGDAVDVRDRGSAIGKGISNYSAEELRQVMGLKSAEVREVLPRASDEAVHRGLLRPRTDQSITVLFPAPPSRSSLPGPPMRMSSPLPPRSDVVAVAAPTACRRRPRRRPAARSRRPAGPSRRAGRRRRPARASSGSRRRSRRRSTVADVDGPVTSIAARRSRSHAAPASRRAPSRCDDSSSAPSWPSTTSLPSPGSHTKRSSPAPRNAVVALIAVDDVVAVLGEHEVAGRGRRARCRRRRPLDRQAQGVGGQAARVDRVVAVAAVDVQPVGRGLRAA